MDVAEAFVAAFNTGNLAGAAACLAEDAVARVEGAPFPEEQGRDTIRDTSLAYLMNDDKPLRADTVGIPDASILLLDEAGRVDVAIRIEVTDGKMTSLVYYTMPHCAEQLTKIAESVGRPVAPE